MDIDRCQMKRNLPRSKEEYRRKGGGEGKSVRPTTQTLA